MDPPAPRAFLYADPAAHSRSPAMHGAAFAWAGLPGHYQALRVPPEQLGAALERLRAPGVLGANLSLPHKEAALPLLDELTPAARAIGAVNTVVNRNGQLHGDNTDAPGFLAALASAGAGQVDVSAPAVVLGAGGAARAAVWALRERGVPVLVLNRTLARARTLTAALGGQAVTAGEVPWTEVRLLVNASSAGLSDPASSPLSPLPALHPAALVYDMVYRPAETRLMREARAAGYRAENGLEMLAQQARLAFLAWTGRAVPVGVFLDALLPEPPAPEMPTADTLAPDTSAPDTLAPDTLAELP